MPTATTAKEQQLSVTPPATPAQAPEVTPALATAPGSHDPTPQPPTTITPRYARIVKHAGINLPAGGVQIIVAGVAGEQVHIEGIVFTVGGETNITLLDSGLAMTGPMDFGAADEPRGMAVDHSRSPIICSLGGSFGIASTGAFQVSGYVTYFSLPKQQY